MINHRCKTTTDFENIHDYDCSYILFFEKNMCSEKCKILMCVDVVIFIFSPGSWGGILECFSTKKFSLVCPEN